MADHGRQMLCTWLPNAAIGHKKGDFSLQINEKRSGCLGCVGGCTTLGYRAILKSPILRISIDQPGCELVSFTMNSDGTLNMVRIGMIFPQVVSLSE